MNRLASTFLVLTAVLAPLSMLRAADATRPAAAAESDGRLQADGQGWRLDKAKTTDPARPRVLLIGDSILNGYLRGVLRRLDGKAYVDAWVNPYSQSEHLNKLLAQVLDQGPYDVVHFNMGLHGWQEGRIKPGTFEPLTKAYVEVIRQKLPGARILWASSTPVTVKGKPAELDPAINPIIVEHNRMAAKVMAEMNVPVNDFYSLLVGKLELARGDQFHWTAPAYELLAAATAESVLRELIGVRTANEPWQSMAGRKRPGFRGSPWLISSARISKAAVKSESK
ncbi:MAG: SGNH/GDSL hydrolase family protein [Thermoguttaceae bacterium]